MPVERLNYPKLKLRRLNWTKIAKFKAKQTIFNLITDPVPIDHPLLIEYFELHDTPKAAKPDAAPRLEVISGKKAQNVALFLANVKDIPFPVLSESILNMDDAVLTEDQLKALEKVLPSDDEILQMQIYKDAPPELLAQLRSVELFFLEILKVPRLHSRVKVFLFSKSFKVRLGELVENVESASNAIRLIAANEKLSGFMSLCLSVGNFLNFGSYAGGAFGFNMDALSKISDSKSSKDSNFTLLDYMAQFCIDSKSLLTELPDTLEIAACSKDQMQNIANEYKALQQGMTTLQEELNSIPDRKNPADSYESRVIQFHQHAYKAVRRLGELIEELNGRYGVLRDFFLCPADDDMVVYLSDLANKFRSALFKYRQSLQKAMEPKEKAAISRSLAMAATTTVLKKREIQLE